MSPLHHRETRVWILLLAAIAACSEPPSAPSPTGNSQPTVTVGGVVSDLLASGTGAPVPNARIELIYKDRAPVSTLTGEDGVFRLAGVIGGEYVQLRASKAGYEASEQTMFPNADVRVDVALTPIRSTLAGLVVEKTSGGALPVAGARVEILTGSNKGMTTTTAADGSYALRLVWGEFDVAVSSPNHETVMAHASVGTNPRLDVQLAPRLARARTTFTGELCTVERLPSWLHCTAPLDRSHIFRLDRPGPTTVSVDYEYVGDYYMNYLTVEMRCGSAVVFEKRFAKLWESPPLMLPDNVRGAVQVTLSQPCAYEFRLFNYIADTKGGVQTKYRIDVDHPQ